MSARKAGKLRIVSRKQQLVRADFENDAPVDQDAIGALTDRALGDGADMLLLSDYDKGVLADPQRLIAAARKHGVPVAVEHAQVQTATLEEAAHPHVARLGGPLTCVASEGVQGVEIAPAFVQQPCHNLPLALPDR